MKREDNFRKFRAAKLKADPTWSIGTLHPLSLRSRARCSSLRGVCVACARALVCARRALPTLHLLARCRGRRNPGQRCSFRLYRPLALPAAGCACTRGRQRPPALAARRLTRASRHAVRVRRALRPRGPPCAPAAKEMKMREYARQKKLDPNWEPPPEPVRIIVRARARPRAAAALCVCAARESFWPRKSPDGR